MSSNKGGRSDRERRGQPVRQGSARSGATRPGAGRRGASARGRPGDRRQPARRTPNRQILFAAGGALVVLILVVVLVVKLVTGGSGTAATPTAIPIRTIPPAPLAASSPAAAEVAASRQACAPFRAAGQSPSGPKKWGAAPKQVIDTSKHYQVKLYTDKGTIIADMLPGLAPITANNFVFLACNGFYDGLIFHRVVPGFVIQGGDPLGNGLGGPGYQFQDEPVTQAYHVGSLAMANSGPNTNGSQFFIIQGPQGTGLPPKYNLFGQVTAGENVVDAIANAPAHSNGQGENSAPNTPVHIRTVTVQVS